MKKIVFTGGGTAGHIMPNIAIIDNLKDYKIYYLGSSGMEKDIISKYNNIEFIEIPSVKFKRSLSPQNLLIPFKLIKAVNKTKDILKTIKPHLVFSKGGYVSLPPCLSAKQLGIPVITHESDLSIGLANKIISKIAKYVCCSFKATADNLRKNGIHTGSPIRNNIFHGNKNIVLNRHKINNSLPIILIVGGSQGAGAINKVIWENISKLTKRYNLIHIVGKNNINKDIKSNNYYQLEFVNDIENYFDASDIVVSRAGSNTIFELLALAKPMILIPLPKTKHSRGDQVDNANYFKKHKLAKVLDQNNLTIESLLATIELTFNDKNKLINNIKNANNNIGNSKIINIIKNTIM